jgi:hypothetical protein
MNSASPAGFRDGRLGVLPDEQRACLDFTIELRHCCNHKSAHAVPEDQMSISTENPTFIVGVSAKRH